MTNLNREEFAAALAKGLGRAAIHARQHGLDDIADLVLEACLHNKVYDQQCESGRGDWLFSMFKSTPHYSKFCDAILAALKTETETWNLGQLFELAKEMAKSGDKQAQTELMRRALEIAKTPLERDGLGAEEWVELGGTHAMLELAKLYGNRLFNDPDDFPSFGIYFETAQKFESLLSEYAQSEPEIKIYLGYIRQNCVPQSQQELSDAEKEAYKQERREQFRQKYTLESIIKDARNRVGTYAGYYMTFGTYATIEELKKIYGLILSEPDDSVRMRLLWVFRRTPLPRLDTIVFDLANGAAEELRRDSIAALAQVSDRQVHDLAKAKAKAGQIVGSDSEALDLFVENYDSSDACLITDALSKAKPDAEDAHNLARSVIELAEHYEDTALADALIWVYENNPCTNCRHKAVVYLDKFQRLDKSIIQECLFDAAEEIREFARKLNNKW